MNLVGKILTGLIALFSIVFMAFVLAVYATHTNWRKVAEDWEKKQKQTKTEVDEIQAKNLDLQKSKDEAIKALTDSNSALRDWGKTLQQANDAQKKSLEKVDGERVVALTTLDITQKNQTDLYAQVHGGKDKDGKEHKGALNELKDEQTLREGWFKRAVTAQDRVQQLENVLGTLKHRQNDLIADAQKYRKILLLSNMSLNLEDYNKVAPDVKGRVTEVSSATGLVEIDIGRDAGLRPGQQLHVYRDTGVVGKVEVLKTDPERAVCKVIPEFRQRPIQRDDHVAANIRLQ